MTRILNDHVVNPANDKLLVEVLDGPGAGGACHEYNVSTEDNKVNCSINFQNGPISENGVNGLTHEVLLSILIDRMRSFQAGPYACRENAIALTKMEEAQMWLLKRTTNRIKLGIEGTSIKG